MVVTLPVVFTQTEKVAFGRLFLLEIDMGKFKLAECWPLFGANFGAYLLCGKIGFQAFQTPELQESWPQLACLRALPAGPPVHEQH